MKRRRVAAATSLGHSEVNHNFWRNNIMKKRFLSSNILLLIWYFLAMVGVKIGDKYLVKGAFKDEWIFMLIPVVTFLLVLFTKKIGKILHLIWLGMWFVTQFLSHEWYTLFGKGFMGNVDSKITYFKDCISLISIEGRYVPDLYHIILHILIIISFIFTAQFCSVSPLPPR
jgi:fluoride ion exporter CrcB/FEX